MPNLLVPVDGSESALRAIAQVVARIRWYQPPVQVHLLNVQHPLHGDVGRFIDSGQIRDYHRDEGLKTLEPSRKALDAAGIPYEFHIGLGDPAEVIVQYANEKECSEIVIGARGVGSLASLFLGSVTTKVIQLSDIPILLVK
jgi:nucleotide-binding universal stress UspA family protein